MRIANNLFAAATWFRNASNRAAVQAALGEQDVNVFYEPPGEHDGEYAKAVLQLDHWQTDLEILACLDGFDFVRPLAEQALCRDGRDPSLSLLPFLPSA